MMGGPGSGYRPGTKTAVEDVLSIGIKDFLDDRGEIRDGNWSGRLDWHKGVAADRWKVGSIGWQSVLAPGEDSGCVVVTDIELWQQPRTTIDQVIIVQSIRPGFGGRRWYLTCGHVKADGTTCYGRATDLYLLNNEFACRTCHNLAYRSTQTCHQLERAGLDFDDDEVGWADRWIREEMDTEY